MTTNSLYVAMTGLNAQNTRMQVISNNLANVNTTGFKRDRANFETLLYQTVRPGGEQTSEGTQLNSSLTLGTGVRVVSTDKMYSQGSLTNTENALDMAVDGQGFFQVLMPDGRTGYTRDGAFSRGPDGVLTTASGYVVQPEITIPEDATQITVAADGIISVQVPGQVEAQEVGQLTLANFVNPRGLQPLGENFMVETPASGPPTVTAGLEAGAGRIVQGSLEASNVNVVQELVAMIETQRAYEINSKAISASDQMMQFLSNKL